MTPGALQAARGGSPNLCFGILEPYRRTRPRRPHRAAPAAYNMAPPTSRPPRGRRHLARSHDPGPSEAACDWTVGRRPSMAAADWPRAGGRGPALVAGAADGGGGSSMAAGLSADPAPAAGTRGLPLRCGEAQSSGKRGREREADTEANQLRF
ncbi:translation initiation factor IF-2-like [Onychostruthus taczanowskii]|uniref:translation initiation factor IF-2-like n=1 Tax=Onychostruthus taczanowskii TaxID=356909 RepID=UPI001B7FF8DC|nr:translation initiation factor IF-2-like [Onychostruthus taczanowskii]